jgi:hypothetical protein
MAGGDGPARLALGPAAHKGRRQRRPTAPPPPLLPGMTTPGRPMHVAFNAPEGLAR